MPFTPFHLGFGLLAAVLFYRWLDPVTLLAASIAVDARAILVFFGLLGGPLHGPLHTLPGAVGMGLVVAAVLSTVAKRYGEELERYGFDAATDIRGVALAGLVGAVVLHLLPDALMYADVGMLQPFHPFLQQPLVGAGRMYATALVMGMTGAAVAAAVFYRENER